MSESPCVGICILENDVCIGCGRTSDEIYQAGIEAMRQDGETPEAPPNGK